VQSRRAPALINTCHDARFSFKRRPHAPIWDIELGQIIVARLVFGFVTRRTWFTRAEVKHSFYKHDGDPPLLSRNMRFNRSTDPHVPNGPRARQPRGCQRS
jgi:hypothetical protein